MTISPSDAEYLRRLLSEREAQLVKISTPATDAEKAEYLQLLRIKERLGPMEFGKINLNHTVRVKLTEYGVSRLRDIHATWARKYPDSAAFSRPFKLELKDGYYSAQLHSLMHDFGPVSVIGTPPHFEHNDIHFA